MSTTTTSEDALGGGTVTLTTEQLQLILETALQSQTPGRQQEPASSESVLSSLQAIMAKQTSVDTNPVSEGASAASNETEDIATMATAKWEPTLTDNEAELAILQELGLGVAIDISARQPWVRKSAFQAKEVKKKEELIVINESNKFHESKEQIETYTAIHADLESGFRPDPTKPISVTIAADYHRSSSRSKTINSKSLLTRTIAFCARDPSRISEEEVFEANLKKWLKERGCFDGKKWNKTTNHHCIQYLNELGGVTHYVSSITLGATKYQVSLNSTLFNSLSTSSGIKAETFVTASAKTKVSSKVFQSHQKQQHIGRVPDEKEEGRLINFRTKAEAVVKCSYTSLANLVSDPTLQRMLDRGINEYIDKKKNGTRGPYHIATAEYLPSKNSSGKQIRRRLYWKVVQGARSTKARQEEHTDKARLSFASTSRCGGHDSFVSSDEKEEESMDIAFFIEHTPNKEEASNFYLKPIIRSPSIGEKYFNIVTDPEDYQRSIRKQAREQTTTDQQDSSGEASTGSGNGEFEISEQGDEGQNNIMSHFDAVQAESADALLDRLEPQRYVTVIGKRLEAQLNLKHLKTRTLFKLKNLQENTTQPLSKSQWLPESLRGSQPHILCCQGRKLQSLRKEKIRSVYIERGEGSEVKYGGHCEDGTQYSYFILEHGHYT